MPSIRQELAETPSARWYRHTRGTQRSGAWADRVRDYGALRAVLADHAAASSPGGSAAGGSATGGPRCRPSGELPGLLKLVAERAHYAGAEPVYRRYRDKQHGQPVTRWAGADPRAKPTAAFLAEAKITGFWPYRDGVVMIADEPGLAPADLAWAYLRALADWAADDRLLAAYRPAVAPACVREDMAVLAAAYARQDGEQPPADLAARLLSLADEVVRTVLDDPRMTPLGACGAAQAEVARLLAPPPAVLTARVVAAVAELSDRIVQADGEGSVVVTPDQANVLRGMLTTLAALLGEPAPRTPLAVAVG
jgi:hypothetical protein